LRKILLLITGVVVLNRTLEDVWREISPYLDEVLDLEGEARERWLAELEKRLPGTAATVRAWLVELARLKECGFLGTE